MTDALFEKVLIATDGSEKGRAVLEEGVRVICRSGAAGYALYVVDTTSRSVSTVSGEVPIGEVYRHFMDEAGEAFDRLKSMCGDVEIETKVLEGKPAPLIVRFAVENDIDLIVIGTQGKTGLERLLLGSVAEEVIRSAPCKVLVVK